MKVQMRIHLPIAFSIMMFYILPVRAQARGLSAPRTGNVQPTIPKGRDPKPEDATRAILAAFDKYEVVGMDAAHGNKDLDDLILHVIRDPAFPAKANDIVVECGNSLYQGILDRYIAGDDVPLSEVQQVGATPLNRCVACPAFTKSCFPWSAGSIRSFCR
jgi:hypothetical protein